MYVLSLLMDVLIISLRIMMMFYLFLFLTCTTRIEFLLELKRIIKKYGDYKNTLLKETKVGVLQLLYNQKWGHLKISV